MVQNKVSAALTDEIITLILNSIASITQNLPFLISLTQEERAALPKYGDKSVAFVQKALALGIQKPDILPRNFDIEEMKKDNALYPMLYQIYSPLSVLFNKLQDTYMQVGSEQYQGALKIYSEAQDAGEDMAGFEDVMDELSRRFIRKPYQKTTKTTPAV